MIRLSELVISIATENENSMTYDKLLALAFLTKSWEAKANYGFSLSYSCFFKIIYVLIKAHELFLQVLSI